MSSQLEHWVKVEQELKKLAQYQVIVGFFGERNSKLLTIVRANEYGAHISPKNGKWLTIPTANVPDGSDGLPASPRDIKGLFRPKGKNVLCINKNGNLVVMFYLKKSVDIPSRPFIRTAWVNNKDKYTEMIKKGVERICFNGWTAKKLLSQLGETAATDIKKSSIEWLTPKNAPATVERKKGSNDPLVDTGNLQRSVTYKIVPIGGNL